MTTAQLCEAGHRSRSTGRRAGGAPRPQADRSPGSRRPVVGKTRRAAAAKQRSTADRASEAEEVGELSDCASDFVVGLIGDAVKSEDEDGYVDMDMEIDDMDTEEVAAPAPEAKAGVRGMVCETLLRGAQSGALFDLLRAVSRRNTQTNEDTKEYSMRSHVFSVLAGASESGQLGDALARIAEGRRAAQTKQAAEIDAADETPTSASARGSDSAEDEDLDEVVSLATDDEEDEEDEDDDDYDDYDDNEDYLDQLMGATRVDPYTLGFGELPRLVRQVKPLCLAYRLEADLRDECAVCLSALAAGDQAWRLPCTHVFHESCAIRLLAMRRARATCPVCRCDIKSAAGASLGGGLASPPRV
mmetsp:Transcript_16824/g.48140  ORF Transcript_16824/g.48140 Transcript_16824/m.48140 type:complete len:359 (+) Transcript_16824:176-1252(+)